MRAALAILVLTAPFVAGLPAAAQPGRQGPPGAGPGVTHVETVRDLAEMCDPPWGGVPRLEAIAYCQGFLTSAGQYHALMYPPGGRMAPLFCVPQPGPSIAESGIGFARWAREQPRFQQEPALDGFLRWAQERFPCPPARRGMRR